MQKALLAVGGRKMGRAGKGWATARESPSESESERRIQIAREDWNVNRKATTASLMYYGRRVCHICVALTVMCQKPGHDAVEDGYLMTLQILSPHVWIGGTTSGSESLAYHNGGSEVYSTEEHQRKYTPLHNTIDQMASVVWKHDGNGGQHS